MAIGWLGIKPRPQPCNEAVCSSGRFIGIQSKGNSGEMAWLLAFRSGNPSDPRCSKGFAWIHKLMDVMQRLVDKGNSILVIEHNLDVIRCADWIVDLGPEGGDKGGEIVVTGTPEEVAEHPTSHTGRYLKQVLAQHPPQLVSA